MRDSAPKLHTSAAVVSSSPSASQRRSIAPLRVPVTYHASAVRSVMHSKGEDYLPAVLSRPADPDRGLAFTQTVEVEARRDGTVQVQPGQWSRDLPAIADDLKRMLPGEFGPLCTRLGLLSRFTQLELSNLKIGSVPCDVALGGLRELDISRNAVREITWLPPNLNCLHAYGNGMTRFELSSPVVNLIHAGLAYNALTSLPHLPTATPALVTLDVSHNALEHVDDLTSALAGHVNLNHVCVGGNPAALADSALLHTLRCVPNARSVDDHQLSDDEVVKLRQLMARLDTPDATVSMSIDVATLRDVLSPAAVYLLLGYGPDGPTMHATGGEPTPAGGVEASPRPISRGKGAGAAAPTAGTRGAGPAAAASVKAGASGARRGSASGDAALVAAVAAAVVGISGPSSSDVEPEYHLSFTLPALLHVLTPACKLTGTRPATAGGFSVAQTSVGGDDDAHSPSTKGGPKQGSKSTGKEAKATGKAAPAAGGKSKSDGGRRSPRLDADAAPAEQPPPLIAFDCSLPLTCETSMDAWEALKYGELQVALVEVLPPRDATASSPPRERQQRIIATASLAMAALTESPLFARHVQVAAPALPMVYTALPFAVNAAIDRCAEASAAPPPVEAPVPVPTGKGAAKGAAAAAAAAAVVVEAPKPEPRKVTGENRAQIVAELAAAACTTLSVTVTRLVTSTIAAAAEESPMVRRTSMGT